MASQNGIIKINGQLGDLVFYKRGNTDVVRQKAVHKQQTEASKKSSRDFGTASRNAAYIRKAFAPLVKLYDYGDLLNRLNKRFIEIFKTIPAEQAGNKKLIDGDIPLLKGFEFNSSKALEKLWLRETVLCIEPDGLVKLILPECKLKSLLKPHPKATEARLQVMGFHFELDDQGGYEIIEVNDLVIPLSNSLFSKTALALHLDHNGDKALIFAMGISFFTGTARFADRRYYACKIIHALHVKDGVIVNFVAQPKVEKEVTEQVDKLSWAVEEG
ncbi:hypothetical protein [Pedobacter alluvionis]|uniref:Uncharacterized protein n=1 Tax=Pedobacter alluvionis TaxID=475253 RepID=A0A497XW29_9SPHI|nr:hypothetical protein [Pedobacter alluvionis]RLJ72652.1 hypothetical protein BCL90_4284 [Pedobacter alluvionis]TFB29501.1 hypothetical protein E3V97_20925 [Pedobacter alluvionis]